MRTIEHPYNGTVYVFRFPATNDGYEDTLVAATALARKKILRYGDVAAILNKLRASLPEFAETL